MSRLEGLIKKLCPNGVEFKTLGEMVIHGEKVQINKSIAQETGKYPVINSSREPLGYCDTYNNDGNSIVLTSHGAYAGYTHWLKSPFLAGALCYPMRSKDENEVLSKFIYYWLQNEEERIRQKFVNRSGVPYVNARALFASPIPLPPLEVQQEIVRILDKFATLEAELEAELEARRKQYRFYREKLLDGNDQTKDTYYKKLGEVCEIRNGYTPSKAKGEYWQNGTIPWFVMEDIRKNGRVLSDSIQHITREAVKGGRLFPANSIILATSATVGEHALITVDHLSNQRFVNLKIKDSYKDAIDLKYLFYYMFVVDEWCKNNVNVSGFASVDMTKFRVLQIPVPPLAEQKRIVEILDKFSTLIDDISSGLPAEIKMRHQQYEYYRDKLLTFTQAA